MKKQIPSNQLITVARFSTTEEAHLFRLQLAAGGVESFILDEYMVQMDWLISNAIGGVRVQISEKDLEHCKQIVQEAPFEPDANICAYCPFCGSEKTKKETLTRRLSFLSMFIIGCPLPVAKNYYTCKSCEKSWNENKRPAKDTAA